MRLPVSWVGGEHRPFGRRFAQVGNGAQWRLLRADSYDRMLRAAKLEVDFYEEVEHDEGALGQATTVAVLSAFAAGIGILRVGEMGGLAGLVGGTLARLLAWYVWALYVWAFLTWYIGTRLLPEPQTHADHNQLLRTIGFSSAPGVILHRE